MFSGSGRSNRRRSREPNESRPSGAPPRLPSLRSLAASRERDNTSPASSRRWWTVAAETRAERIRNLDSQPRTQEGRHRSFASNSNEAESQVNSLSDELRSLDGQSSSSTLREFRHFLDNTWDPAGSSINTNASSRSRSWLEAGSEDVPDRWDRSLDQANSHLRALLESTNAYANLANHLTPPRNSPPPHRPSDLADDTRRSKRRKLDSERSRRKQAPLRYGKFGQVHPGQLRMEMVSCDGGMFSNEFAYAVENILKNDSSVYCTKGNRCNIVLRHQGDTPFTLKELLIKGPTSMNYSHPIREGMVFVAMHSDEILQRTAQYQIQYAAMPRTSRNDGDSEPPRRRFTLRRNDGGDVRFGADTPRRQRYRGDDDDYRIAQMPPEFTAGQPNVGVSTECSDEDDGDGDSARRRRAPNRIGSLPFEDAYSDDDDDDDDEPHNHDHDDDNYVWTNRALGDLTPMPPNDLWDVPTPVPYSQESSRLSEAELLAPHARFFIEKKKSTCTIRFDPPVSGRYILLKMWNSHHDPSCNIDIQSVMAKGFAGPRFFPSVELR